MSRNSEAIINFGHLTFFFRRANHVEKTYTLVAQRAVALLF